MKRITEIAPAKVNIYLKVIGKRPDGYHDIETLFERIDILDKIVIAPQKKGITIKCNDPDVPLGEKNICHRAASLLTERYNISQGVLIVIDKDIPVAAGLGGGSSDAAAVLRGMNKLFDLGIGKEELSDIGGRIGSDVPFFLADASFAVGSGRGERLKPVKKAVSLWHLVIAPFIKLLSGDIYNKHAKGSSLGLTKDRAIDRIQIPTIHIDNVGQANALLHNDLEDAVLACEPIIREIKERIVSFGAQKAIVSGSGPSVFALYENREDALKAKEACLKSLPLKGRWRAFTAETC